MKLDLTQKVLTRPVVANFEKFLYAIKIYVWITSDWLKKNWYYHENLCSFLGQSWLRVCGDHKFLFPKIEEKYWEYWNI